MAVKAKIEGWLRRLEDGDGGQRMEIFLKVENYEGQPDRKIRASGLVEEMTELVEWFEEKTGLRVESPILPKRVRKPIPGQLGFEIPELHLGEPTEEQASA